MPTRAGPAPIPRWPREMSARRHISGPPDCRVQPMPRFAILEHDHPLLHWDFLLETGDVLRTWRLQAPPPPGCRLSAEPLAPHRKLYLDYEGPVSGNRGQVKRFDGGTFTWLADE